MLLIAGVMLAATTSFAEVRLTPNVGVELSYTDNVDGSPRGTEDGDIFTTLTPSVTVNATSGRGQGTLRYGLTYDEYSDRDDLSGEGHELAATGRFELWRQRVFLDVQAALTRQVIDRTGAISAVDRSLGTNQTEIFNHLVGLTRTFRHKDWVISDSRYSISQSITDPLGNSSGAVGTPSNTTTHLISHVLTSGSRFTRLRWNVTTSFEENVIEDGDEVTDMIARLDTEYSFNRFVSGIATAGYEKLDTGDRIDSTSAPTWTIGSRLTPGPRTSLRVEYGRRFDGSFYDGDFSFAISPTLGVTASFRQDVSIQQATVDNALTNLGVDDFGNFINTETGLPFSATGADADLTEVDNINRTKVFNISLSGTRGRNTYGSSLTWSNTKTRTDSRTQTTKAANITFGRRLTPKAQLAVNAGWADSTDNTAADTETMNLSATFDYRIGTNLNGAATVSHLRRDSNVAASELDENIITARLQITF